VRETAGATLGRTQDNLNYISLEELGYICELLRHPASLLLSLEQMRTQLAQLSYADRLGTVGVRTRDHIRYQVKKVVPWAFAYYIRYQVQKFVYWALKSSTHGERSPPKYPARPDQLYKWAWDEKKKKEEREEEEERQRQQQLVMEDQFDAADSSDPDEIKELRSPSLPKTQ
jgi:hypothetical protein